MLGKKQVAAFAALMCAATPSMAVDSFSQPTAGVTFYFSVPLDAPRAKDQTLAAGFAIQGTRPYERVTVDSRMINNFLGGGIEAKWVVAGVVAAGAVVAVASRDKSTTQSYQEQQQAQQQQIQQQQQQQQTGGGGGGNTSPCRMTTSCPLSTN
jgi:hypothetical protein